MHIERSMRVQERHCLFPSLANMACTVLVSKVFLLLVVVRAKVCLERQQRDRSTHHISACGRDGNAALYASRFTHITVRQLQQLFIAVPGGKHCLRKLCMLLRFEVTKLVKVLLQLGQPVCICSTRADGSVRA